MFLFHEGLEIGSGEMGGAALELLPTDKETVGQTSKHSQDEDGFGVLNSATIVVVGNVEPLMEATFNAPPVAVKFEPLGSVESTGRRAGDDAHGLRLAALCLAQQTTDLGGKRKAHVFSRHLSGA